MAALKIKWSKTFLRQNDAIAHWYLMRMGKGAMLKFVTGMKDAVWVLSHSPQIGTLHERYCDREKIYYSFLAHPHYRIIYRFTAKTLYVIAIYDTRMKH